MKIDRDKSEFLDEVIDQWKADGLIDFETEQRLKKTYEAKSFDWSRLAQYAFWLSIACGFFSLVAFLKDDSILSYLKKIYDTPDILISLLSASIAAWFYYVSFKRKQHNSPLKFSTEAILFGAILLTANALAYFGKSVDKHERYFSLLILCSVFIYGAIGYFYKSKLTWIFALISLGAWFGSETGHIDRKNYIFLGMNYPLRFVAFGAIVTALAFVLRNRKKWRYFFEVSYVCGLFYLFVSLWLLSIFGNFSDLEAWHSAKQTELFMYAIVSVVCCVISILIGLKFHDKIAQRFGVAFLFLNLYTRYCEYFWDTWHRALFFMVLAASFWLIGRKAEKIWNLKFLKN